MTQESVSRWVGYWAGLQPDAVAIDFHGATTSWAELDLAMRRGAVALDRLGVGRGDRVAVLLANRPEYLELWFAAARRGAALVPVNTRLAPPEIDYLLRDSGARALVTEAAFAGLVGSLTSTGTTPVYDVDGTGLGVSWPQTVAESDPDPQFAEPGGEDMMALLYTSGTTGRPKGSITTHRALQYMTTSAQRACGFTAGDRHYVPIPLCFTGGLVTVCQPAFATGGTIVLKATFDPRLAVDQLRQDEISFWFAPAPLLQMLRTLPSFDPQVLAGLKAIFAGAAPVPVSTLEYFRDNGIVNVIQGYGLTEGCGLNLVLPAAEAGRKVGSAGRALMFSAARVVRPDGSDTEPGERGELALSGPQVTTGYWGLDKATHEAFIDGWLRTGDAAVMDDDGYITIVDRLKDMIISGAMNVYPAEVEDVLLAHPDVAEAAVVGQPHEVYGESVVAFVVPRPGATLDVPALLDQLRANLADYKVPRAIEAVTELPRTTSGKVQKFTLRERLRQSPLTV